LRLLRLKWSLIRGHALKALEDFLGENFGYDLYSQEFADDLASLHGKQGALLCRTKTRLVGWLPCHCKFHNTSACVSGQCAVSARKLLEVLSFRWTIVLVGHRPGSGDQAGSVCSLEPGHFSPLNSCQRCSNRAKPASPFSPCPFAPAHTPAPRRRRACRTLVRNAFARPF